MEWRAITSVQRHLTESTNPATPSFQRNVEAQMPERTTVLLSGYSVTQASHKLLRIARRPGLLQ
jgi:hypothetical protein